MTLDPSFRELFSETVTLYPPTALDKYGKRSFAASGVSASAHYMAEERLLKSNDGRDVVVKGKLLIYGNVTATTDYRIVLDDGSEPIIVSVDYPHDQDGVHHTVILVGE